MKAALVDAKSLQTVCTAQYPDHEMEIIAEQPGWAEQHPDLWWENLVQVTKRLMQASEIDSKEINGIGLSYQMHGLVLLDKGHALLRPAIIWCDSRAVEIGEKAFADLGEKFCLSNLLNSPGNFTASKLKWVKDHEPNLYARIEKVMLPGDYINFRLTGELNTTISGLSEGIFWDFNKEGLSNELMEYFDFDKGLIPELKETFEVHGLLSADSASQLGLSAGTLVGYRAGDQPNNAMALGALNPGEVAATGGTSGVVFGVVDRPVYDSESRVNAFAHVNHQKAKPSLGVLLCINGAGIQYSWMRKMLSNAELSYKEIEELASKAPIGSDGLRILPFGNGAERMLGNLNLGSRVINLQLNRHSKAHMFRSTLEGIAYAFVYGIEVMKDMGLKINVLKVGNDNLFQSAVFSNTIAAVLNCKIELIETSGAIGAAKGAGVGIGLIKNIEVAVRELSIIKTYRPEGDAEKYKAGYALWKSDLMSLLN